MEVASALVARDGGAWGAAEIVREDMARGQDGVVSELVEGAQAARALPGRSARATGGEEGARLWLQDRGLGRRGERAELWGAGDGMSCRADSSGGEDSEAAAGHDGGEVSGRRARHGVGGTLRVDDGRDALSKNRLAEPADVSPDMSMEEARFELSLVRTMRGRKLGSLRVGGWGKDSGGGDWASQRGRGIGRRRRSVRRHDDRFSVFTQSLSDVQ